MLECVPNFSEGTDRDTIEQIVSSIKACPVLDVHSDPDHNRTVVTFAGETDQVELAAYQLTEKALELIDINLHTGVHPFIGAVDVIPFIPLSSSTMEQAISAANELGKKLWKDFNLPVYFYGYAAKIPERADLPYVRKGGFSSLRNEIALPHRKPDLGEGLHQTAGAAAIGARDFLIAFNVNLNTSDLSIAQSIAKNLREKYSGMKGVRALGLYLESRKITQVSINLTDHRGISLKDVYDAAANWAREYRVRIIESELVGMIPKFAAFPGMEKKLKLRNFSEKKILEYVIYK